MFIGANEGSELFPITSSTSSLDFNATTELSV